jgi:threonine/homoserine/homoserine lactone efflux protein
MTEFAFFLAAALVVAVTPGPGLLYVAARSLSGGRGDGIASSIGTGLGGSVHIAAGAIGVSALVLASAEAFTVLKLAGACYLIWLGVRTIRSAGAATVSGPVAAIAPPGLAGWRRGLGEGFVVEALNPKTAAFFLAFIPQFVDPSRGGVAMQFALLGAISVTLNTVADIVVAFGAASVRDGVAARPGLFRRLTQASGAMMCALGAALAFARRPG